MSSRGFNKNNVIAGVFVLAAVALAVLASVVISGATDRLTPKNGYVVRFSLADGAAGLKEGSVVHAGGQPVGTVTGVRVAKEDGVPVGIDAAVAVRKDLALFEDAWVYLEAPLLGGMATLNIPSPGAGKVDAPRGAGPQLEEGEILRGHPAPPAALAQAGYGPDQAMQVRGMIKRASEVLERIDRMTARAEEDFEPILAGVKDTVEQARGLATEVRESREQWAAKVDATLDNAVAGTEQFEALAADGRKFVTSAQEMLDRNTEGVSSTVESLRSASAKIDQESVPLLNETLAKGGEGAESFRSLAARAEQFLIEQSPSMRRIVGNFRLAADQIKLAAIEIRTKPWLLLYTPKMKEVESQALYGVTRMYAEAVSDLRAASESLEAAAASDGSPLALDRQTIEGMQGRLKEAFETYQKAEQDLLDMLIQARNGG